MEKLLAFLIQLTFRYRCPGFLKLFTYKQLQLTLTNKRLPGHQLKQPPHNLITACDGDKKES